MEHKESHEVMPLTQEDFVNDGRNQTEANPESLGHVEAIVLYRL